MDLRASNEEAVHSLRRINVLRRLTGLEENLIERFRGRTEVDRRKHCQLLPPDRRGRIDPHRECRQLLIGFEHRRWEDLMSFHGELIKVLLPLIVGAVLVTFVN